VINNDNVNKVAVIGATSFVGERLLTLLTNTGCHVTAFSRQPVNANKLGVEWRHLPLTSDSILINWVCVAPIWVLPDYFSLMEASGVKRLVVLSSTTRFTKVDSTDPDEQALALQFAEAEACVQAWSESHGVEWVIIRPTLIYDLGRDKNISEIAYFINRFGFFPLFGKASGLRQPIHAEDVASACISALSAPFTNRAYNISGGEALTYRNMVAVIFAALGRRQCILTVPLWVFRIAMTILRIFPRFRLWKVGMAERMNRDMVFDHSEAERDLGFKARRFDPIVDDLPACFTKKH
jgi:nucleoside-diphosphate-sugar epimerase